MELELPDLAVPVANGLSAYGWTPQIAQRFADLPAGRPARVVRVDRGAVLAVTDEGPAHAATTPGQFVVTGDWVALGGDPPVVLGVAGRTGTLVRRDPSGTAEQALAANVDVLFIVCGLDRPLKAGRIERLLVLAWEAGAVPVLVLAKADLAADHGAALAEAARSAPGVDAHLASALDGRGIERLRTHVPPGSTVALLGESGAGKSTLINALVGSAVQRTGDVRRGDRKGRHTTTVRELVPVPGGGVLLDTPGLREIGLVGGSDGGMAAAFPDIDQLTGSCRFRDCAHQQEPGCAVLAAVESGALDSDRLVRWHKLRRELAREARKHDARARAAHHKQARTNYRRWSREGRERKERR